MRERKRHGVPALLLLLMVLSAASLFRSPGTSDVAVDLQWMTNAAQYGIVRGFEANVDCYPPILSILLHYADVLGRACGATAFASFKAVLLVFLFLTSLITFLWTRNWILTALLHFALLHNCMAMAYLDIFMAPTLIGALWAISRMKFGLGALFFSLSCLTKFQPLLIAPFLLVHLVACSREAGYRPLSFTAVVLLPGMLITSILLYIFGAPFVKAFVGALRHPQISANALNLNWILTYFLHVFAPGKYGSLIQGRAELIMPDSLWLMYLLRGVFAAVYCIIVALFVRREKSFKNLLLFSLTGYMAYFTLCTGVHENHLFLASILVLLLCWLDRTYWKIALAVVLLSNLNPFLFYGWDGGNWRFNPVQGIDLTLVLSAITTVQFAMLLRRSYVCTRARD